ncbi:MAG: ATP-binding protein [Methanobacterium sp.]
MEDANINEINESKLKGFLKEAKARRNLDFDPIMPIEEALNRLKLCKKGKLTNAAILLFGLEPQNFVLQANTKCARFKGIDTNQFDDMRTFEGSIIDQRDDAIRFAEKYIKRSAKIKGSDRVEEFEYPLEAIREAISNALCHRDYRINCKVQLRIFDDRLEIWGCGPLPEPLTVDDLKGDHDSILRNPLIADCFFKIGFIENWGTGTKRIISSCLENGLPEPIFEIKSGSLVVTLNKFKFTDFEGELNERQKKALDYLKTNGKITNREYREINGVKRAMTVTELKDMVEKRLIIPQGKGPSTHYILA